MRYGYVCTNYNNSAFTVTAVETLLAQRVAPETIVIVDNHSGEDDVATLRSLAQRVPIVRLILSDDNVGYFAGLNLGLQAVRGDDLDCCVIGNNDLEFPAAFSAQLRRVLADRAHDLVIAPDIVTLDGHHQNPHVIAGISRLRELVYDLYYAHFAVATVIRWLAARTHRFTDRADERSFAQARYIYQGHGSCYIVTRAFFDRFDSLWAPTFMMSEEYFLSHQLAEAGFRVYFDPRMSVRHRCNGALDKVPARRAWGMARDAHHVYRRYVKPWHRQAR